MHPYLRLMVMIPAPALPSAHPTYHHCSNSIGVRWIEKSSPAPPVRSGNVGSFRAVGTPSAGWTGGGRQQVVSGYFNTQDQVIYMIITGFVS
ncbi:hypothetical protein C8J57DRAFT_1321546 [Mycena rebaudengoi]|nr:hypothetical protein C8J57DRAFT_1321546 [Mycena rebaudengoi]